jgi:hypothetical protein
LGFEPQIAWQTGVCAHGCHRVFAAIWRCHREDKALAERIGKGLGWSIRFEEIADSWIDNANPIGPDSHTS